MGSLIFPFISAFLETVPNNEAPSPGVDLLGGGLPHGSMDEAFTVVSVVQGCAFHTLNIITHQYPSISINIHQYGRFHGHGTPNRGFISWKSPMKIP